MHYLTITSINDSQENCLAYSEREMCFSTHRTKSLHITALLVVNTRHRICYWHLFLPPSHNKASNVVGPEL